MTLSCLKAWFVTKFICKATKYEYLALLNDFVIICKFTDVYLGVYRCILRSIPMYTEEYTDVY